MSFPIHAARRWLFAAVLILAAAPALAARTVLVLGDSLSAAYGLSSGEGWVSLLAKRLGSLEPPWKVVNASISGETTAGGVRRVSEALAHAKPDIVLIELGANDALRGQPVDGIRTNLQRLIREARKAHAKPVLVGIMIPPNYGIDYAAEFRDLFPALARSEKVPLVPFLLAGLEAPADFQADQLHPTAAAQPRVLDNVWSVLAPLVRAAP